MEELFCSVTFISEVDRDLWIQVTEFLKSFHQDLFLVSDGFCKDTVIRPELYLGTFFTGSTCFCQSFLRDTFFKILFVAVTVTVHCQMQVFGKCIDNRNTHPVKTAGNFVRVFVEFTTGMEHGKHNGGRRNFLGRVLGYRDTSAIVFNDH